MSTSRLQLLYRAMAGESIDRSMAENATQKTVLITGCSSGIGRCAAEVLRERGYRVFATARKQADVEQLRSEQFEAFQLDLNDSLSIKNAVANILDVSGGQLDALFNNGAYGQLGAVEDLSRDAIRSQFETNLFGWLELTNLILPVMRKQQHGRIVQCSSVVGLVAMKFRGAYTASKFALEGLTDTLRRELHNTNIKISLIEPGPIRSNFRANALQAFHRFIVPELSYHKAAYQTLEDRLNKLSTTNKFTLSPDAVVDKLIHALESPHPKARYYVTLPTVLFSYLRPLLSTRQLDAILSRR